MPETLRELISRGPVEPLTALGILRQLLNSLAFAHWRGMVNGHITPDDIVLTSTGRTTTAHFGTAQESDSVAGTHSGTVSRNAGYLAPEQIHGQAPSQRADVFALGVVAQEMLAGRHPFETSEDPSAGSLTDRILQAAPLEIPQATLAALPRHVPPALATALAKNPKDRFPDAMVFLDAVRGPAPVADALVQAETRRLPGPFSPRDARSRRMWLAAALLGGLVVVVAVVLVWLLVLGGDPTTNDPSTTTSSSAASVGRLTAAIVPVTTTTSVAPTITTTTIATTTTTTIATTTTTTTLMTATTTAVVSPTRHEQNEPGLVFSGDWSTSAVAAASGGSFAFVNSTGASVSVTFEGTYLAWIARKSPLYGIADVALDGRRLGTIDLFSESQGWGLKVWGTGQLEPGRHTVTISWTGTKNPAAIGTNISVDAFDVVGSLAQGQ